MAVNLFVIDDAKCLHDILDFLQNQNVVAPTNHASATDEYGKGSSTVYGHLMITAEAAKGRAAWSSSSTYAGKAVSGADGKNFDTRIKENTQNIATLNGIAYLPVGITIMSTVWATAAYVATKMGYGTWELLKHDTIVDEGGATRDLFYYIRTA